ncbi:hypothetical protein DV736_g5218, partial [Chaetothyriales sp. CBS 134916]
MSRQSLAHVPVSSATRTSKDNATVNIATLQRSKDMQYAKKKSRGKSIGPGGLEALIEPSRNVRGDPTLTLKSILKPSIPLTPPKVIPSFHELRSNAANGQLTTRSGEDLLIDFSTPGPSRSIIPSVTVANGSNHRDPFSPLRRQNDADAKETLQTEAEKKETEQKRQAEKRAILDRRAERRKSLANRRVSFAPEATLHTWSVMELVEDSTASSGANSTRHQSSMTTQQSPNKASFSPARRSPRQSTTPLEQAGKLQVAASPAHQQTLCQTKRQRTSSHVRDVQPDGSMEDTLSSSPADDSITESSPIRIGDSAESESDDDTDGGTAMSMDDTTAKSMISEVSLSTQLSLDERLQERVNRAGTRGIVYDEYGDDAPMEMATATVTNAFQPWLRGAQNTIDDSAMQDQENMDPLASALKGQQVEDQGRNSGQDQDETQDMSMDVTHAVGGIINGDSPTRNRRKSSQYVDDTMDFTSVGGGILATGLTNADENEDDGDVSIEFTRAVGGILSDGATRETARPKHKGDGFVDATSSDISTLPPIEEQTEPQTGFEDDRITCMEMTKAVGKVKAAHRAPDQKTENGLLTVLGSSQRPVSSQPQTQEHCPVISIVTETGSPDITLKPRLSGRSRQTTDDLSTTPKFSPKRVTPVRSTSRRGLATPTKPITPSPARGTVKEKTPLSANVTQRGASPRKLFREELQARASPISGSKPASLFFPDELTGRQMPGVLLKAPNTRPLARRMSSGIGIDNGYGSPQVTNMLHRRTSIGDTAPVFQFEGNGKSKLRLEDPRQLEREVDSERADEERRESGRFIMEQEANKHQEENAMFQLKEMIESMTPKKHKPNRLKGRKSLAMGAAKGLLGKRPVELDVDDEEEAESTPKRLKIVEREGSPVKKIHLPKPPSKEETTGRFSKAEEQQLEGLSGVRGSTTPKTSTTFTKGFPTSPHIDDRYKEVPFPAGERRVESFEAKMDNVMGAIDVATVVLQRDSASDTGKISLQEFLNLTNVHFIELSTTKRRQTMAQSMSKISSDEEGDRSIEATFVAAATTLPLLELYQHATRELKSYISSGRKIIRSIEAETLIEQPPLFREYIDARADVKAIMDNQFRNGKTNARYQSKEGWYTWRTQLVEGLQNGLEGIKQGMAKDLEILDKQSKSISKVAPSLLKQQQSLRLEIESVEKILLEVDSVDTNALRCVRENLRAAEEENSRMTRILEELRQELNDKADALRAAEELKTEMEDQITEADRVRREFRGWSAADVLMRKEKVDTIERETGWRLSAAEEEGEENDNGFGVALTLMFHNQLRLFFYPSVYQVRPDGGKRRRSGRHSRSVSGPNAPISLTYSPEEDNDQVPRELSTEKRFFLQLIRSQLQAFSMMPKGSVSAKTLLDAISGGWSMAEKVEQEIRLLSKAGITTTNILSDERLRVKIMLMQERDRSRIDVEFGLLVTLLNDGDISASVSVSANGVYGPAAKTLSGSKLRKVQTALSKEVESKELGSGAWIGAIHGFEEWVIGQSQRQTQTQSQTGPKAASEAIQVKENSEPASSKSEMKVENMFQAGEEIKRSPLAPKTGNTMKKALPRPSKPRQPLNLRGSQNEKAQGLGSSAVWATAAVDKENMVPGNVLGAKHVMEVSVKAADTGSEGEWKGVGQHHPRPAIAPEEQERMMTVGTPVKRVGALRRSPI